MLYFIERTTLVLLILYAPVIAVIIIAILALLDWWIMKQTC